MVLFGQIVVGPPGAGKTFYCRGMQSFMHAIDRKCAIVNLDFANDTLPYEASIDVRDLVSLERVMEEFELGPNGGLVYCMEYLLENIVWLKDRLKEVESNGIAFILFDCPGQVELYTHHTCMKGIVEELIRGQKTASTNPMELDCRLCSVHLVDSFYCCEPSTFISAVLLVASSMLRLGLPHVNVLSKVDLLPMYGPLPFSLDFFTEMVDLTPLLRYLENGGEIIPENEIDVAFDRVDKQDGVANDDDDDDDGDDVVTSSRPLPAASTAGSPNTSNSIHGSSLLQRKYRKMSTGLCEVLSDFGLISFLPMNVDDGVTVGRVLSNCDKANGYSFAAAALHQQKTASSATNPSSMHFRGDLRDEQSHGRNQNPHPATPLFNLASQDLEPTFARSLEIFERYEQSR